MKITFYTFFIFYPPPTPFLPPFSNKCHYPWFTTDPFDVIRVWEGHLGRRKVSLLLVPDCRVLCGIGKVWTCEGNSVGVSTTGETSLGPYKVTGKTEVSFFFFPPPFKTCRFVDERFWGKSYGFKEKTPVSRRTDWSGPIKEGNDRTLLELSSTLGGTLSILRER